MATTTTTQQTTQQSPTRFLDRQINTYGMPQMTTQQPQQQTAASGYPYMPNGSVQPAPQQPPPQPSYYQPATQQASSGNYGSVDTSGVYHQGSTLPMQQYAPQQVQQFQMPNYSGIQNQQASMIGQLLQNPYTLGPQQLAQMKGQNADQAALLARQNLGQLKAQLGARGIATDQGMGLGQQRQVMSDAGQQILNGNRQIDLQAAQQNRQDLMNALGMADQFQNSALNRATTGYQAQLAGLGANRDEATTALQSQLQNYQAGLQGAQLGSQSQLASIGNQLQQQQLSNQANQFAQTFGLDTSKFDYQKQLDAQQLALQQAAQSQSAGEWADQMAFQYQKANQDAQNNLFNYLFNGGSGGGYGGFPTPPSY